MDPEGLESRIISSAANLGVVVGADLAGILTRYLAVLLRWRTNVNLVAQRDAESIIAKHICDCLFLAPEIPPGALIADLGSGAGLPGLVLAAARSDVQVTLVEPKAKRVAFLRAAIRATGLRNAAVLEGRAEDIPGVSTFDVVCSRAVWSLGKLLPLAARILRPGGTVIAMQGPHAEPIPSGSGFEEVRATEYRLGRGEVRHLITCRCST